MDFIQYIQQHRKLYIISFIIACILSLILFATFHTQTTLQTHYTITIPFFEGQSVRDAGEESASLVTYLVGLQHTPHFLQGLQGVKSLSLSRSERSLVRVQATLEPHTSETIINDITAHIQQHLTRYSESINVPLQLISHGHTLNTRKLSFLHAFLLSILGCLGITFFSLRLRDMLQQKIMDTKTLAASLQKNPIYIGENTHIAERNILPLFKDQHTYILVGDGTHGDMVYRIATKLSQMYNVTVIDGMLQQRTLHTSFMLSSLHAIKGYTQLQNEQQEALPYVLHTTANKQLAFAPAGNGDNIRAIKLFEHVPGIKIIAATFEDSILFSEGRSIFFFTLFSSTISEQTLAMQNALHDSEYIVFTKKQEI